MSPAPLARYLMNLIVSGYLYAVPREALTVATMISTISIIASASNSTNPIAA